MAISTPFSSPSEAEDAYYGSGSGGGDDSGGDDPTKPPKQPDASWGELQNSTTLGSSWVLAYQQAVNSDRRRWFVIRMQNGLTALKSNGSVYEANDSDTLGQLPHYSSESDARNAFDAWAKRQGEGANTPPTNQSGDTSWGEWSKVRKVGPWFIFGRTSKSGDKAQFIVGGKRDGKTIYLAPEAKIVEEPHIYSKIEAAKQALDAYQQSVADGDTPPGMQPNGNAPATSTVRESVSKVVRSSQSQTKTQSKIVERLGGKKIVIAGLGVVGVGLLAAREGKK